MVSNVVEKSLTPKTTTSVDQSFDEHFNLALEIRFLKSVSRQQTTIANIILDAATLSDTSVSKVLQSLIFVTVSVDVGSSGEFSADNANDRLSGQ
ncbi:hypothetical protein [Roseovarius sp. 2305UL8-3]|uniref:hypothetical protein n=1 Tax=Roseovarius conchicola TaxID=3121636 RepID=UPI003527C624